MANKSNDETNLQIGTMLRKARESKGFLQSDMCETTGLTKNHISAIERGVSKASIEMLLGYCKKLDMTPNDILEFGEYPVNTNLQNLLIDLDKSQQEQIAVIIKSVKNFADTFKNKKNDDYLHMIDKSMTEAEAGRFITKTIADLETYE